MRDRPQRMTCYPKEKIGSLNKLSGCDPRIRTPLERRPSDAWHNVIKRWRLLIRIDKLPNDRNPKSISHYPRGNSELNTSYPTPNKSVGIIDVAREVREELSNQGGRGWMIYLQQKQLAFTLKVRPNGKINIIWHNKTLSPNFSLTVQFLKHLSAFVIPKQLTPRGRLRGRGGCPICSSLPRHGARIRTKTQSKTKRRKNQG